MKNLAVALSLLGFVLSGTVLKASEEKNQAFNICVVALLGDYFLNYEYLFLENHGLAVRLEHVKREPDV